MVVVVVVGSGGIASVVVVVVVDGVVVVMVESLNSIFSKFMVMSSMFSSNCLKMIH